MFLYSDYFSHDDALIYFRNGKKWKEMRPWLEEMGIKYSLQTSIGFCKGCGGEGGVVGITLKDEDAVLLRIKFPEFWKSTLGYQKQ